MSEITPGGILDRVVQELPNFFRDGVDQLVTGEGEYIRAGEPQGTVGKVGQAIARSYCRQYGADPGAAKFGNAARIENACRPYLDDQDPGKGAGIGIPFEGGQCPDIYQIWWDDGTGDRAISGSIQGPLTFVRARLVVPLGSGPAGTARYAIEASGAGGFVLAEIVGTFSTAAPSTRVVNLTNAVDNCGDPPPVVTQPGPIADPSPPPFRFNPNGDINVNVGVDILPDGTINVGIGGPTVNVDPFGGGGGGDTGGGDADPAPPPPGDIGSAGGSADTGAGGEAEGEAPEGSVLVGLKIDILTSPPKARQFATGVFRGACYIYMGVASNLDQDYGGSMLKSGQFFFAEKENLTHWQVSANNGYNHRITPYYREVEE